jgi:glycosyltransferase involved in cell wall biosynthesis
MSVSVKGFMMSRNIPNSTIPRKLEGVKVCMVVNQIYYTDTRVMSYANALVQAGAQVDIIASRYSDRDDPNQHPNIKVYSIPVARNYRGGLGYILNYVVSTLFFILYASVLFIKRRYCIMHIHNMPDTLILAALLPRFLGAKAILDIHDPMPNVFMSKYRQGSKSAIVKFFEVQEKISANLADAVITANPLFRDLLVQRGIPAQKILVVNNIPSPQLFDRKKVRGSINEPRDKFTLIFPGTIAPRYCLDIAIKALPKFCKEIPNLCLKIIGKHTQHAEELAALASELGVAEYVNFVSFVPADQISAEIAKADVGIYTALPDPHMSIAMPIKVLEYVTMGIPVVASRLPILEAFFDETSILFFSPGNVDGFASHVLKLHRDPALRRELTERATNSFLGKYSWKDEFDKYLQLICKLTLMPD